MDNKLTQQIKNFAYSIGADLVGIANIERYENAPIAMSPQGILPTAKSVIVCAIHHPDAAIELDGEVHPQIIGPYRIQYTMNNKLDYLSFSIARLLDDLGHKAVPIASSNIWRYRGYKELDADFAPDISHIYSGVCAGLGKYFEIVPPAQQYGITQWCPLDSPENTSWRAGEPTGLWDINYNRKPAYAGFANGLAGN